jgi:DamX protein
MQTTAQTLHPDQVPLHALLGLDREAAGSTMQNKFFFASPLISQRLSILKNMVGGSSLIVVVTGERGSGKTTLMNQYIADPCKCWQMGRIRLKPRHNPASAMWRNLNNRRVCLSKHSDPPSVIIDDAHQLSAREIRLLLQWAFPPEGQRKLHSIVLLAEPQIREHFAEIAGWLPPKSVIDKIHMTPLTQPQTAAYLLHRIKMAGYSKASLFSEDQLRAIHKISCGLPGPINSEADRLLNKMRIEDANKSALGRWQMLFPWKRRVLERSLQFSKN